MNSKIAKILLPYALLASGMGYDRYDGHPAERHMCISKRNNNSDLKCFTKGCKNKRSGARLFCSAKCKKLHDAGKIRHQLCIFPQLSQEKLHEDFKNFSLDATMLVNATKSSNFNSELKKLWQEKYGYEIVYHKDHVIIHN